eukprot:358784-Chlamydomonas_euryale.AAC.6
MRAFCWRRIVAWVQCCHRCVTAATRSYVRWAGCGPRGCTHAFHCPARSYVAGCNWPVDCRPAATAGSSYKVCYNCHSVSRFQANLAASLSAGRLGHHDIMHKCVPRTES